MDRLHTLEVFASVAETGGFARAARGLGLSPAAVTRAVAALEERLGVRLLDRTTRKVAPTEAGRQLLLEARRLLAELDEAERSASGATAEARGHLTVTASATFGRGVVTPILLDYLRREPKVTASLVLLDRNVDLIEEGIDVAVRIAPLPSSGLIARKVGEVRRLMVASPAYLAARGRPQSPMDLVQHDLVAFGGPQALSSWWTGAPDVPLAPRLAVNDAVAAVEAAKQGYGITFAMSYVVAEALADGALEPVLAAFAPPPIPVHLVHLPGRTPGKVRAFLDMAAPLLQASLRASAALTQRPAAR